VIRIGGSVKKTVNKMAEFERTVGELYRKFAEKFDEQREFWMNLALQEEGHAKILTDLPSMMESGTISYNADRFDLSIIEATLDQVRASLARVGKSKMSLRDALYEALHVEQKILEKAFYAVFNTHSDEAKRLLNKIVSETNKHSKSVQEKLNQCTG